MNGIQRGNKYYKKYAPIYVLTYVCALWIIITAALIPQVTQLVINRVIYPVLGGSVEQNDSSVFAFVLDGINSSDYVQILSVLTVLFAILLLSRYVCHYARWTLARRYYYLGSNLNREAGYAKFLDQSQLVLNSYSSGETLNFLNGDVDALRMFHTNQLPEFLSRIVYIGIYTYFLVRISPYLAIAPAVVGICLFFIARPYFKKSRKMQKEIREANVDLNTCIQENINGVRIVRSYASEKSELKKFEKKNKEYYNRRYNLARLDSTFWTIFRFLGVVILVASIILGIVLVTVVEGSSLSVGEFATFTTYALAINTFIIGIATGLGSMQNSIVFGNRQLDFIDEETAVKNVETPLPMPKNPTYEFKNVSMVMKGKTALKNVSFTIPYGEKVGIMGKTGSGKSVLIKLLNRFYDVTDGEILVNGINIKEYDLEQVRKSVSLVMQDVFLFSETVEENIAFFENGEIDKEKVQKCATSACADNFINKLDDGYETIVGERGLGLSGGQKQRVSISRALYKDAPVIMLDDCTSALDFATEKKIMATLNSDCGERTMLVATHRANSVADCDNIIYLENGEIAEMGNAKDLIKLKGKYYDILIQQERTSKEEV